MIGLQNRNVTFVITYSIGWMWQHDFNVVLTLGISQVLMLHISGDETLNGTQTVYTLFYYKYFNVVSEKDFCFDLKTKGVNYNGRVSFTDDSKQCLPWNRVSNCKHHLFNPKYMLKPITVLLLPKYMLRLITVLLLHDHIVFC